MQDNATCHKSKETLDWLKTNKINVLNFPANSPNLNSIENVWGYLDKIIRKKYTCFNDQDHLWRCLEEEWYKIPKDYIHELYFSMCTRIHDLNKVKGHNTQY